MTGFGADALLAARRLLERGMEVVDLSLIDSIPMFIDTDEELAYEAIFVPNLNLDPVKTVFGAHIEDYDVYRAIDLLMARDNRRVPAGAMAALGGDPGLEALALAAENKARLHADNVQLVKSDLFVGLTGRHYDLIVTNPPYVTNDETDALPKEYSFEPELGLRAGDDGLDLVLKILRDAPLHLSQDGLLICEVGESEHALVKLLPDVDFAWIEFKVGQMGIFAVECAELIRHNARIAALAAARK